VASLVGVGYEGLGVVTQTATLHVSADFSPWAPDPDVLIRWIFSPQAGVLVVMVPMGPQRWGPASEEWVIHLNYPVDDPRAQSDAQVEADARQALGLPDIPWKIHKITRWAVEAVMASAFRAAPRALLGRGAPRPPAGWASTSAIHDAQNLCWKVAAAAYQALAYAAGHLRSRAAGRSISNNAQRSLENAVNHFAIGAALGILHETAGQNMELLRRMWSAPTGDAGHLERAALDAGRSRWSSASSTSNTATAIRPRSSCLMAAPRPRRSTGSAYQPSTRPGSRCRTPDRR
jgi:2,4-dichlorophenol 6-monooxygenase